jgi:hypothetical protein
LLPFALLDQELVYSISNLAEVFCCWVSLQDTLPLFICPLLRVATVLKKLVLPVPIIEGENRASDKKKAAQEDADEC